MRTLIFLLCGFLLVLACRLLVRVVMRGHPSFALLLPAVCAGLWLVITLTNLFLGITQAGYSVGEELPIFLILFLPPTMALFWPKVK